MCEIMGKTDPSENDPGRIYFRIGQLGIPCCRKMVPLLICPILCMIRNKTKGKEAIDAWSFNGIKTPAPQGDVKRTVALGISFLTGTSKICQTPLPRS